MVIEERSLPCSRCRCVTVHHSRNWIHHSLFICLDCFALSSGDPTHTPLQLMAEYRRSVRERSIDDRDYYQ